MFELTRREIIKSLSVGAGLSPLMLPILQQLRAEANGDATLLPKRFLFVIKCSGLTPAELVPQGMRNELVEPAEEEGWPEELKRSDKLIDVSLAEQALPTSLKSLESLQDHLTIVQGLSGKMCRGGHSAWYGAMGCYHTGDEGSPGRAQSATIDGLLAKTFPAIFPHIGLTLGGKVLSGVKDSVVYPGISAIDTDRPLPYQASPDMAYKNLFGVAALGEDAKASRTLDRMLLDHLVEDVKRTQAKTAFADREKLEQYLESFEGLQDRRRRLHGLEAKIREFAPSVTDKFSSNVETDRIESHFDMAAAALVAGLSNVITIRTDTLDVTYRGLGISKHVHGLGHSESVDGMTAVEARNRIRTFHIEQIAGVAKKLKAIPEGNGTMLDNTLIVYFSDAAEKHHGSGAEWPFVMLGGLGGKLKRQAGGRYLQYPGYESTGNKTIANFYNTLMHAVGKPQDEFGRMDLNMPKEAQRGPLVELLT